MSSSAWLRWCNERSLANVRIYPGLSTVGFDRYLTAREYTGGDRSLKALTYHLTMRRRVARHLFAVASAASLLLCLAACVMWVRSIGRGDLIAAVTSHTLILRSEPGLLFLNVSRAIPGDRPDWWYDRTTMNQRSSTP